MREVLREAGEEETVGESELGDKCKMRRFRGIKSEGERRKEWSRLDSDSGLRIDISL